MANTPPYVNDALRWVAMEVRYPVVEEFGAVLPPEFRDRVQEEFPVLEEQNELSMNFSPTGPSAQQALKYRFSSRDRLASIVVGRDAITCETTLYPGWTPFRERFTGILYALQDARRPEGTLRVGLRYIDEIRVPGVATLSDWTGWISDNLIAPFRLLGDIEPSTATLALQYGTPPGFVTLFRGAPFPVGRTVQPEGPLRMPFATPDGPYFLLDTDASWADPDRQIPEFDVDRIVEILNELHEPSNRLFEASITDRLRDEVLRRPLEEVWAANG